MFKNKSFILSLIFGFVLIPVSAFAVGSTFLATRNVYGILSENFTGAVQNSGYETDNILLYKWSGGNGGKDCQTQNVSDGTALEGNTFVRFTCDPVGSGWSGGGYTFIDSSKNPKTDDISRFRYLDFWIRKKEGNINQLQIGVGGDAAGGNFFVSLANANVDGGTGNGVNNNSTEWQHVVIDIKSFSNADLTLAQYSFLFSCNVSVTTIFDIDNVVLRTDSLSADFNITLKKVEDMEGAPNNPTQITWTNYNGWQAAAQYVEIDADKYGCGWTLRLYTNNGASSREGLWAQGTDKEYTIPMCYRVCNGRLYNFIESPMGNASYLIGQSAAEGNNLYDRGVNPNSDPGFYPWVWLREYTDLDLTKQENIDAITVWDSRRGYHIAMPFNIDGDPNKPSDGFESNLATKVDKTLRVYFGGGFGGAAGGITYTSNVVFELNYE